MASIGVSDSNAFDSEGENTAPGASNEDSEASDAESEAEDSMWLYVNSKTELELLKKTSEQQQQTTTGTSSSSSSADNVIEFKIVKGSLSANNKFYLDWGEKPPFNFFKTFPVQDGDGCCSIVTADADADATSKQQAIINDYVHPPVWGLCQVTKSQVDGVTVGTVFRAMLPMASEVSFPDGGHIDPTLGNLIIHRSGVHPAYNNFTLVPPDSVSHPSSALSGLALACSPGIVTGFGLYFALQQANYYDGCDTIVLTSASSKVSLSLALYLKQQQDNNNDKNNKSNNVKVMGYSSEGTNKEFCQSTGLYTEVLDYDEQDGIMPESWGNKVIMIDVSGKGTCYTKNSNRIHKLLVVGNSSGTPDKGSTASHFTKYASLKMILTMMGGPRWIRSRMNPTQELFLIMDTMQILIEEWGKEKYLATLERYTKTFCEQASQWIKERNCDTEDSIKTAFEDIVKGTIPPSECIVLDFAQALAHRKE